MKKQFKLGVIGCGFMANSIIKGVVKSDFLRSRKIIVSDPSTDKLDQIEEYGVFTTQNNKYVVENSEFLLLAVKPQHFSDVVKSLDGVLPTKVISIMAGVKKNTIKNSLGVGIIKVARCMPNLPCSIGTGAMGIDMIDFNSSTDDIEFIHGVFDSLGTAISIDESKMDAVTGISGSGPAYCFLFLDALVDAGIKHGLTKDESKTLAVQTMLGAAELVSRDEQSISELIKRVCSKGGTTIEAIKVFEEKNFRSTIMDAVDACIKRAEELSKE